MQWNRNRSFANVKNDVRVPMNKVPFQEEHFRKCAISDENSDMKHLQMLSIKINGSFSMKYLDIWPFQISVDTHFRP